MAVLTGVAGLLANVLLILFFGLARPFDGWASEFDWLGPANDSVIVVQFAALVPVALALRARVPGPLARWATAVGVAAMTAVVTLQLMLVTGLVPFEVQVGPVVGCLAVTFGWLLAVNRAGRRSLPRPLVRFGTAVGVSYLAGLGIAGSALLLPGGSDGQYVVFGLAIAIGLFGWLGFPVWPLLARRVLREER